jgi:hypothetical protein
MKKNIKKNPSLTASQMKMRMRMEKATTSLYHRYDEKTAFLKKKILVFNFFVNRAQFLRR